MPTWHLRSEILIFYILVTHHIVLRHFFPQYGPCGTSVPSYISFRPTHHRGLHHSSHNSLFMPGLTFLILDTFAIHHRRLVTCSLKLCKLSQWSKKNYETTVSLQRHFSVEGIAILNLIAMCIIPCEMKLCAVFGQSVFSIEFWVSLWYFSRSGHLDYIEEIIIKGSYELEMFTRQ